MTIEESRIIESAKNCIDDVLNSMEDSEMDGWTRFYLGKVFGYIDVLDGCKDYEVNKNEQQ